MQRCRRLRVKSLAHRRTTPKGCRSEIDRHSTPLKEGSRDAGSGRPVAFHSSRPADREPDHTGIHTGRRRVGVAQTPPQIALPVRPAGMSEDVVLGGARFSWLQNLSDAEILRWPELPPSFPDDMDSVRDRVRGQLGHVDVPPTWDGARSEIRRLLRTDAGRLERQRRTSVVFPLGSGTF
jgi:hypothetical protein